MVAVASLFWSRSGANGTKAKGWGRSPTPVRERRVRYGATVIVFVAVSLNEPWAPPTMSTTAH